MNSNFRFLPVLCLVAAVSEALKTHFLRVSSMRHRSQLEISSFSPPRQLFVRLELLLSPPSPFSFEFYRSCQPLFSPLFLCEPVPSPPHAAASPRHFFSSSQLRLLLSPAYVSPPPPFLPLS